MKARNCMSDTLTLDYKVYLEPVLAHALNVVAKKHKTTRSKYLRAIAIREVIREKYPLLKISKKFNAFKPCA